MLTRFSSIGTKVSTVNKRDPSLKSSRRLHSGAAQEAKSKGQSVANSSVPVLPYTFSELLEAQIAAYPHKDAYESKIEALKWTTHQLNFQVKALSGGLHEWKTKDPRSYAVSGGLRAEVFVGLLASPKSGKRFSAIPIFRNEQLLDDLNRTQADFFLFFPKVGKTTQIDEIYKHFPSQAAVHPNLTEQLQDTRVPTLRFLCHTAKRHFNGMFNHKAMLVYAYDTNNYRPGDSLDANAPASLIFDGDRLVALSQSNLINTGNSVAHEIGLAGTDAVLNTLDPWTAVGQSVGLLMPLVARSKIVHPTDVPSVDLPKLFTAIPEHGINTIVADESLWNSLLTQSQQPQVALVAKHIKKGLIVGGSKPINPELVNAVKSTLGIEQVHTSQGSPLTSGVSLVNGKPLANTQVKLVDSKGKDTTSTGNIAVKGINTFKGYWTRERTLENAPAADSWVVTDLKASAQYDGSFSLQS